MEGDRIAMSQRERDRLKVMAPVLEGRRTQAEAARLCGVSDRTIRRWQRRLEEEGDGGMVHRLRGRPSNARKDEELRERVLAMYAGEYPDFGPTLAAEKLAERGLLVASGTLRGWLMEAGLWKGRRRRQRHRSRRERRACFGELVQVDGSVHDWLEGRGQAMTLLVMIDDATSRVLARFHEGETTAGYYMLLGGYLRRHGRMQALYADGNTIFFARDADNQPVETQFGRAARELGIELIPAGSPQAKGRVERFNGTAQDRLVKLLRMARARTMDEANRVLEEEFLPWFNRRCAVEPSSPNDAHRPLAQSMRLEAILSMQETRRVANDYTIRFARRTYQLLPPALPGLRGGRVTVESRLDGSTRIRFKDRYLKYEQVKEPGTREPSGTGRKKTDGQKGRPARQPAKPPADHPWRRPFKRTAAS